MSILDDAIREHLALKRAHGANDAEVKKLEDEAFGPPQRPDQADPFAEAPTEFLVSPSEGAEGKPAIADENARSGRREPNIADLQEAPPPKRETEAAPATGAEPPAAPAEEEQPAGELALPPQGSGPNTAEREAIADQPTEMFDVQAELSGDTSATPPTSPPSPSDEELVDASQQEPRLTPVDPESGEMSIKGPDAEVAGHPPSESEPGSVTDEHDEYFSEQRLSDELDQALEAPLIDEEELPELEAAPPAPTDASAPPVTDEHAAPVTDEGAAPFTDEHAVPSTDERDAAPAAEPPMPPPTEDPAGHVPTTEEGTAIFDIESEDEAPAPAPDPPAAAEQRPDFDPDTGHEDVLEDTPDFLEDAPEDDDLWFEQKPPKDFDFDD